MAQTFTAAAMSAAADDHGGNVLRTGGLKIAADLAELYLAASLAKVAGRYYRPARVAGTVIGAGAAMSANVARFLPVHIHMPTTVDQLFATFTTAGSNYQVAFYNDNNGQPGTEICHSASAVASTTFTAAALSGGGTAVIPAGLVWMGINVDNAATVAHTIATSVVWTDALVGSTTGADLRNGAGVVNWSWTTPLTFGTWGDLTSATFTKGFTAAHAVVGYRAA